MMKRDEAQIDRFRETLISSHAERVDPVSPALIALVGRDRHFTTRLAHRATERPFRAAGSHALFEGNELQRCFRDVHAVASQITRLGGIGAAGSTEV
jgi:alkylation response protein AidB-like acyl-CoA dehydrogenase